MQNLPKVVKLENEKVYCEICIHYLPFGLEIKIANLFPIGVSLPFYLLSQKDLDI